MNPLAESWECSVHPDGPCYVANGRYKGKTLKEVLDEHPEYIGTKANGEFPILAKFIDAKKDLSVQVHPDDEYAREKEKDNGKTEMWYIIDADEGASLIYGFKHKVTKEIQESSNVTYRVYDYDRVDKNGKKRELHFDKAVQVMDMGIAQT